VIEPEKKYVLDGQNFDNLEGFYDEVARVLIPDTEWGRNLDAFNDILRGNFGPLNESNFVLIWKGSQLSRERLGDRKFDVLVEIIQSHEQIELILE
jgi:RNAse (barnase) inhibitor barstar